MSEHINKIDVLPADVSLMLRAHAELRCLQREVLPVLRQLETGDGLPEDQHGAALAYLEMCWLAARGRAHETDTAHRMLRDSRGPDELRAGACRYYDAARQLRSTVGRRVSRALEGFSGRSAAGGSVEGVPPRSLRVRGDRRDRLCDFGAALHVKLLGPARKPVE